MKVVKIILTTLAGLLVVFLCGAALLAILGELPTADRAKVFIEMAKAILQFVVVVLLGGLVGFAVQNYDKRRIGQSALQTFRQEYLRNLAKTYRETKRIRRRLRAAGLTTKYGDEAPALNATRRKLYSEQMDILNEVQLELEELNAEAKNIPGAFSDAKALCRAVHTMESYLHDIFDEFSQKWAGLATDPPGVVFGDLGKLADFTGPFEKSQFRKKFTDKFSEAQLRLRGDLLPIQVAQAA